MVNSKGYIINAAGDICTRQGKVLFKKCNLKNGEFPKVFPFTRFNIARCLGDFDLQDNGQPALTSRDGFLFDKQNRPVNSRGYLIDGNGNVIDTKRKVCFEKNTLDANGDIPEIFQSNLLRSDSQSSLSRLMSEIDKEQMLYEHRRRKHPNKTGSDTSFESMMDESPSKYDTQNQRLVNASADGKFHIQAKWTDRPDDILEESYGDLEAGEDKPKRRRKKRAQAILKYVVDGITERDVMMAQAYGGEVKPRVRKAGSRFATSTRAAAALLDRANVKTAQQNSRERARAKMQAGKEILFSVGSAINSERKGLGTATNTANMTYSRVSRMRDGPQGTSNIWQDS